MTSTAGERNADTASGVVVGVSANLIWGLAFLVPVLLASFDPVAITMGRYLSYGAVSLLILLLSRGSLRDHPRQVWLTAVLFGITGNVGYYFFLVQGVELVGAPVVTVIIGTLPVTVALYGNWRRREYPFSWLAPPVGLILVGLVLVNLTEVGWSGLDDRSLAAHVGGIGCAVAALALWTWFGVANASFLKANPHISSVRWSTMVGCATLALSMLAVPLVLLRDGGPPERAEGSVGGSIWWLVFGSLVLGVLVSWGGTVLWNSASNLLPISIAGQLIVFETLSGLTYVLLAATRVPPPLEVVGIAIVITGVLIGIRRSTGGGQRARPRRRGTGCGDLPADDRRAPVT
jgi:drug/metabolite transporter (DMT)-like permease